MAHTGHPIVSMAQRLAFWMVANEYICLFLVFLSGDTLPSVSSGGGRI